MLRGAFHLLWHRDLVRMCFHSGVQKGMFSWWGFVSFCDDGKYRKLSSEAIMKMRTPRRQQTAIVKQFIKQQSHQDSHTTDACKSVLINILGVLTAREKNRCWC